MEDFVIILFRFDLLFNSINSSLIPSISKQIGLKTPKKLKPIETSLHMNFHLNLKILLLFHCVKLYYKIFAPVSPPRN